MLCLLWLDAAHVKRRVDGRSVSSGAVAAIRLGDSGRKRPLGSYCIDTESYADRKTVLLDLRSRGMDGVQMVSSDPRTDLARITSEPPPELGDPASPI